MSAIEQVLPQLKAMIATMLMVPESEIGPGTSLASLNTSLGAAKVRLGLKRLGLALPAGAAPAATFGGLVSLLGGQSGGESGGGSVAVAAAVRQPVAASAVGLGGLQVGLDVEDIRSLPVASDYWEHEFYRGTFAKSEIAYAVLQVEPKVHFAGFWCAKEALRKCDSSFAATSLDEIAVAHDPEGRPYLTLAGEAGPERLPHALSISHTTEVATAVVVASLGQAAAPALTVASIHSEQIAGPSAHAGEVSRIEAVPDPKKLRGLAKFLGV